MVTLKLKFLKAFYKFYDQYAQKFPFVCTPGCATCCTHNVLITTLEGVYILSYLKKTGQLKLLEKFSSTNYLRPRVTPNQLAHYCIHKIEPPEDESFIISPCPFLTNGKCPIYEVRPFNCRSLFSEKKCHLGGEAIIHPLLLTVNIIFTQLLEQLDTSGLYGNMLDVLSFLANEENLAVYMEGKTPNYTSGLLPNKPLPGFLYPPEHQLEVKKILEEISQIEIERKKFNQYFKVNNV